MEDVIPIWFLSMYSVGVQDFEPLQKKNPFGEQGDELIHEVMHFSGGILYIFDWNPIFTKYIMGLFQDDIE